MNKFEPSDINENQIPPLSNLLRFDIAKYNLFISDLSYKYNPKFLDWFFDFLEFISTKPKEEQAAIIENPVFHDIDESFGIYLDIFQKFIKIYGEDKPTIKENPEDLWEYSDEYFNTLSKVKSDYIKKLQNEIANAMDPESTYKLFVELLQKNLTENWLFDDMLSAIVSSGIWEEDILIKGISVSLIRNIVSDQKIEKEKEEAILEFFRNIIKPYLLNNLNICQDYIYETQQKQDNENPSEEEIDAHNEEIYNKVRDRLISYDWWSKKIEYNETYMFARPIMNNLDFERLYQELLNHFAVAFSRTDFDSTIFGPLDYIYTPKTWKPWHIRQIKYNPYIEEREKDFLWKLRIIEEEISPIDYISKLYLQNEDEYDNDDEDEDDDIEKLIKTDKWANIDYDNTSDDEIDKITDLMWNEIKKREEDLNNMLEWMEESQKDHIVALYTVRRELPEYYQIGIYVWYNHIKWIPTFTIQLDHYKNEFDKNHNWISIKKSPKPVIIKPTFGIDDEEIDADTYMKMFVNFMDSLSPTDSCLEMMWIEEPKYDDEDDNEALLDA